MVLHRPVEPAAFTGEVKIHATSRCPITELIKVGGFQTTITAQMTVDPDERVKINGRIAKPGATYL
jgi:hypothetical protein